MTARAKLALALVLSATALDGGNAMASGQGTISNDNCAVLAHYNAAKTAKALFTFSMSVFGKHPERWTVADIENLKKNAIACDNKPVEYTVSTRVFSSNWRFALGEDSVKRFLAISNKSTQVAGIVTEQWPTGFRLPYCGDLLKWRRDPVWLVNNSSDLFERSFVEVKDEDSPTIKLYVESCLPVIEEIMKSRKLGSRNASKITSDIVTALERDISARRWTKIALVPELQITHDGKPIPLAYTSNTTRDVVLKINTSEQNKLPLDIDTLSTISTWVTDMNRKSVDGPDALYVAAVKKIVSRQLFEQEKRYDRTP